MEHAYQSMSILIVFQRTNRLKKFTIVGTASGHKVTGRETTAGECTAGLFLPVGMEVKYQP